MITDPNTLLSSALSDFMKRQKSTSKDEKIYKEAQSAWRNRKRADRDKLEIYENGFGAGYMAKYSAPPNTSPKPTNALHARQILDNGYPVKPPTFLPPQHEGGRQHQERLVPSRVHQSPRPEYLKIVSEPSPLCKATAKSKLLISDLDNTLYAPIVHQAAKGVVPRPYLKTFLQYVLHPDSPYQFAPWTFSSTYWGIKHIRMCIGNILFEDNDENSPLLAPNVAAFWGLEQSGLTADELNQGMSPGVKDLNLMWDFINKHDDGKSPKWNAYNSLIMDDQDRNARAQPYSLLRPPVYRCTTDASGIEDDWLLLVIGALDFLSTESNVARAIKQRSWQKGFTEKEQYTLFKNAHDVCRRMGIKVVRGKRDITKVTLSNLPNMSRSYDIDQVPDNGPPVRKQKPLDEAPEPIDSKGRVSVSALGGCCQNPPHPDVTVEKAPLKTAKSAILRPSSDYLQVASIPSNHLKKPTKCLVVFDLDGTLYTRPPCHIDPHGVPSPRPYLKSLLTWLLAPESPWTVAIWSAGLRSTVSDCLSQLNLGISGVGKNGDIVPAHPKIACIWTRENLGLDEIDFKSYVKVVKDLGRLWDHLRATGQGKFDQTNTVMVDDTPEKLLAQPYSVITAPTYIYPLSDTHSKSAAKDDFLLQLVPMLDDLSLESNFSNFIHGEDWIHLPDKKEARDLADDGEDILRADGVPIKRGSRGAVSGGVNFPSAQGPNGPSQSRPVMHADIINQPPPYSDYSNSSPDDFSSDFDSNYDPDYDPNGSDTSSSENRYHPDLYDQSRSFARRPAFVSEQEELARMHNRPLAPSPASQQGRLGWAVRDWGRVAESASLNGSMRDVRLTDDEPYKRGAGAFRQVMSDEGPDPFEDVANRRLRQAY